MKKETKKLKLAKETVRNIKTGIRGGRTTAITCTCTTSKGCTVDC